MSPPGNRIERIRELRAARGLAAATPSTRVIGEYQREMTRITAEIGDDEFWARYERYLDDQSPVLTEKAHPFPWFLRAIDQYAERQVPVREPFVRPAGTDSPAVLLERIDAIVARLRESGEWSGLRWAVVEQGAAAARQQVRHDESAHD